MFFIVGILWSDLPTGLYLGRRLLLLWAAFLRKIPHRQDLDATQALNLEI